MMEAADEEEALRLSLEEMDLQEKRRRLREEEAEEACRMIESVGSNGRGTLGWQDRAGDETYDGLGGGPGGRGSEPYSHIVSLGVESGDERDTHGSDVLL